MIRARSYFFDKAKKRRKVEDWGEFKKVRNQLRELPSEN